MTALGEYWFARPSHGWWTLPGFPEFVSVRGRRFRKARWKQEYPGVVEQYREVAAQNSMHLKVSVDGRWIIDHIDEDNPDLCREVPHFFNDHPVGKVLKFAGAVAALAAGACLVAGTIEGLASAASRG